MTTYQKRIEKLFTPADIVINGNRPWDITVHNGTPLPGCLDLFLRYGHPDHFDTISFRRELRHTAPAAADVQQPLPRFQMQFAAVNESVALFS